MKNKNRRRNFKTQLEQGNKNRGKGERRGQDREAQMIRGYLGRGKEIQKKDEIKINTTRLNFIHSYHGE